ncbi:FAD-dependent oxidoreductase [Streptomyces mayonensis]|uniref:FAD-dependent oxidoreductase n=1 Tax=Streptomyces mayonensis TaxID=2750816 RepID=UPI001C1E1C6E|nr:FAD-dependent oxidoreductase [Streptomyces sp. A108]MBU6529617.1 FAD-dependent monooxygenase [Streptomyces sp. A108]
MNPRDDARRQVLIVGGGIAGMTAAIALADRGHSVEVAERNPDWSVTGWGLSLTGPSLRALHGLGLAEPCIDRGFGITQIANCDAAGEARGVIDLPLLLGPELPAFAGLSRGALHEILREAASAKGAVLHTGMSVDAMDQTADGVTVRLTDGTVRNVDLVIGADGIRSKVRDMLGIPSQAEYTDQMVWRAIVPRPAWATMLHTFAGPVHNAGLIPISRDQAYAFVTENYADQGVLPQHELADRMRDLLGVFSGKVAEMAATIKDAELVVRRPVQAGVVSAPWHQGRVVIIGDAAHAPSPQLVSGAALAIEDSLVLAEELGSHEDVESALEAFEQRRRERCRLVVETSVQVAELERDGHHGEAHKVQDRCHQVMAQPI